MVEGIDLLKSRDYESEIINKDVEHLVSSIKKDFADGFDDIHKRYLYDLEESLCEKNTLVFLTRRKMHFGDDGKSNIYVLEIDYNPKNNKITHIYLVR